MVLAEGKTKIIRECPNPNMVVLETKDVLTGGDAARREEINEIGIYKTEQAANIFSLLNRAGIPTTYIGRHSINELLCYKCDMLPLEFVARRYAFGSYLLRYPFKKSDDGYQRFQYPKWEVFHKHAVVAQPITDTPYQIDENKARERYLKDGVWAKGVHTDPYVDTTHGNWAILAPKESILTPKLLMVIPPVLGYAEFSYIISNLILPTFKLLENALKEIETEDGKIELVDLKIEVGRRTDNGQLVIADVIDNDSWRIWVGGDPTKQLDKQCFRDGHPLAEISSNYAFVAELTKRFAYGK